MRRAATALAAALLLTVAAPTTARADDETTAPPGTSSEQASADAPPTDDATTAATTDADGRRRWTTGGTRVHGGAAQGEGATLAPGLFHDELPPREDRWYRVHRVPGTTLFVSGAFATGDETRQELELEVMTHDGDRCVTGPQEEDRFGIGPRPDTRAHAADRFAATAVVVRGAEPYVPEDQQSSCAMDEDLLLRVRRAAGEATADLQLQVLQQPVPDSDQDLPDPASPTEDHRSAPQAATTTPVTGAGTFALAPALTTGGYTDTIRPGEQLFYKVQLGYGQSALATVQLPDDPGTHAALDADATPPSVSVSAYAPVLARVDPGESGNVDGDSRALSVQLPRVEMANMTERYFPASGVPGWYYLVVQLDPGIPATDTSEPVPIRIDVLTEGQAEPEPKWVTATVSPSTEPGEDEALDDAAAYDSQLEITETTTTVHGSMWPWIYGVLGLAALVAATLAWARSRRR